MDGERHAAWPQHLHEGGPVADCGWRDRVVPVVEQCVAQRVAVLGEDHELVVSKNTNEL